MHERMLEIGGGVGIVSRFLHDHKVNITGIEKADVEFVAGSETYFYTSMDAFSIPDEDRNKYTVILLFDVIEHISDPESFISKIIAYYPFVKAIVITVPACRELWSNYDEFNGHFKRYHRNDLEKLLPQRLSCLRLSYFDHVLYPVFYWYARVLKRRSTTIISPKSIVEKGIHRFLSLILQFDHLVFPSRWKGTSLIAVFSVNRESAQ